MPLLDEFFPFDIGHGQPANTTRWRKMAQLWQSDGVVTGYLNTAQRHPAHGWSARPSPLQPVAFTSTATTAKSRTRWP